MKIDKEQLNQISKKLSMLSKAVKKLDINDINELYKIDSIPGLRRLIYTFETRIIWLMETYKLDEFDAEILDILLREVK